MASIIIKDLTFGYEGNAENVFERFGAVLDSTWKTGLTGRNGRGKTTFLKLLAGYYPYTGQINAGSIRFEYFPVKVESPGCTVREVLHEVCGDIEEWDILKELSLLRVRDGVLDRVYSTLSKGEQTKVLIAALFLRSNAFLLIDEPTNHLDASGRKALSSYLKRKSTGFIVSSHDRAFLDGCADHIMALTRTGVEIRSCNMSEYLQNKQFQDDFETAQNEKLTKQIKRLNEAADRTAAWSEKAESEKYGRQSSGLKADRGFMGAKAAKIMGRAKAVQKRAERNAEEKAGLLKDIERGGVISLDAEGSRAERLVGLRNVVVSYGGKPVTAPVSFEIMRGERVLLSGGNGSGKTSIIRAVLNESMNYSGEIYRASGLKISYVSQDTSFLHGSIDDFCENGGADKTALLTILNKLGVEKTQYGKDIAAFSEGQKKKLLIAKSLCDKSNLYIWDEPLNYVDIISRLQIEEMLLTCGATLLFVEHDKYFCDKIATRVINL